MIKKALIFGITGQDGSYLAELLLSKGYEVYGVLRRCSTINTTRLANVISEVKLYYGDLTDTASILKILSNVKPTEIYNLGAQSDVKVSFDVPEYSGEVNAIGTTRLLEVVHELNLNTKIYNACTSEMFGNSPQPLQNELTAFNPVSPYGTAKLYSYYISKCYRDAYGIFVVNGIAFNHESPRRGVEFVTKKICHELVHRGQVQLGNIHACRDWGYAPDYVEGMWLSLQQDEPDDYVFATGETHSVKEFCDAVLDRLNIPHYWENDFCISKLDDKVIVKPYVGLHRPIEVNTLCGDASKAIKELGWQPKVTFNKLVDIMVEAELSGKE